MDPSAQSANALWPLAAYFAAVVLVVAGMMALAYVLGERRRDRLTGEPYESGIAPTDPGRLRLSARFCLVAMLFVIFDLEAMFVLAWAVAFRETGWAAYAAMLVFLGVLAAALAYLWREGALDWAAPQGRE